MKNLHDIGKDKYYNPFKLSEVKLSDVDYTKFGNSATWTYHIYENYYAPTPAFEQVRSRCGSCRIEYVGIKPRNKQFLNVIHNADGSHRIEWT